MDLHVSQVSEFVIKMMNIWIITDFCILFNMMNGHLNVCILYANIRLRFMIFILLHVLMDSQVFNPFQFIIQKMYLTSNKDIFE